MEHFEPSNPFKKTAAKSRCGDVAALICATTLGHTKMSQQRQVFSHEPTTPNPRLNAPVCRAYSSEFAQLKANFPWASRLMITVGKSRTNAARRTRPVQCRLDRRRGH